MEYRVILKQLRNQKHVSQEELAKYAGVTKSTISKYERGKMMPNLDVAKPVADFFGVSVDSMVCSDDYLVNEAITERSVKELLGLPRDYIKAVKLAFSHGVSPDDLIQMVEMVHNMKKNK